MFILIFKTEFQVIESLCSKSFTNQLFHRLVTLFVTSFFFLYLFHWMNDNGDDKYILVEFSKVQINPKNECFWYYFYGIIFPALCSRDQDIFT